MRIAGKVLSLILLIGLLSLSTAMAQDDMMDLDALLDDIGSISEEPSSSEGDSLPLVEEDVAVIQEDDAGADSGEGVFDDDFSLDDLLMDIPEEVADEPAGFENDADADDVSAMDDAMMLDVKQEDVSDEVSLDDLLGVTEDKSVSPSTDADDWSDHVEEVVSEPVEEIPPAEVIYPGVVGVESVDEQVAQDPVAEEQTLSDEDKKKAEKKQRAAERRRMRREAKLLAQQELVRLQAIEAAAVQQVEEGYAALTAGENPAAIDYFTAALERLPEGAKTEDARLRAEWGLAEADYQLALTIYNRKGDIEKARKLIDESIALRPDFRPATKLSSKIEREERRRTLPIPPADLPEIKEQREEVANLLREGSGYYQIGEYDKAEALFERVLLEDEYNTTAMRYLKRIGDRKYKRSSLERDATVARMMGDVRNAWNPPIIEEVELPDTVIGRGVVETKTATQRLQEKMEAIIIPAIEFRQANINDVVNFLVDASIAGDPEGSGVNIILNLSVPGMVPVASEPAPDMGTGGDIWGAEFGSDLFESDFQEEAPAMDVPANTRGIKTITLNLRRISLMDAIKYITEVAALKYRIEDNAVIITPAGVVSGRVITRMYPVQPSILDVIVEKEEPAQGVGEFTELGSGTVIKRSDVKEFFEKAGVPFPVGTSITYNQSISQLIVANTPDNLEIFERILAQLNVIPNQVEIEARFVEVSQTDLEEMGLEWILTDNWEIMSKNGNYPAGGREQIQMNADNSGITKGLRFFNVNTENRSIGPASTASALPVQKMLGGIMSFSSVLTNPELSIVLHALSQSGGGRSVVRAAGNHAQWSECDYSGGA